MYYLVLSIYLKNPLIIMHVKYISFKREVLQLKVAIRIVCVCVCSGRDKEGRARKVPRHSGAAGCHLAQELNLTFDPNHLSLSLSALTIQQDPTLLQLSLCCFLSAILYLIIYISYFTLCYCKCCSIISKPPCILYAPPLSFQLQV